MKTKALISLAVTVKLIYAFGFAYSDCWFSHEAAHILLQLHPELHPDLRFILLEYHAEKGYKREHMICFLKRFSSSFEIGYWKIRFSYIFIFKRLIS